MYLFDQSYRTRVEYAFAVPLLKCLRNGIFDTTPILVYPWRIVIIIYIMALPLSYRSTCSLAHFQTLFQINYFTSQWVSFDTLVQLHLCEIGVQHILLLHPLHPHVVHPFFYGTVPTQCTMYNLYFLTCE